MASVTTTRISIFPLPGAILFPGMQLPLHMFEPRYRAMVSDAMARDRQIGMIQPTARPVEGMGGGADAPDLFKIGCLGRIADVEAMDDGRYNVMLEGVARFRLIRELDVKTPFRQIEAELIEEAGGADELAGIERASLERESKKFADAQGYSVDWSEVARLDDVSLVNGVSQIAPFDSAAKQALLEANSISERADLIIQLMQFFRQRDDDDPRVTLQ